MNLQSRQELDATREKLRLLQQRHESLRQETAEDEHVRQLTLQSLKHLINQLEEEIVRFEGHAGVQAEDR